MSEIRFAGCPDWRTLADSRDERAEDGPWRAALDHLDGGCRACRDAAYAADPTLVFRRGESFEPAPGEVADLTAAVRAMIRAGRMDALPASDFDTLTRAEPASSALPIPVLPVHRPRVPSWRVASLAAALVALLVGTAPVQYEPAAPPAEPPVVTAATSPFALDFTRTVLPAGTAAGDPVEIETLNRPSANVYQFDDPGMAVVLIVDSGLDV